MPLIVNAFFEIKVDGGTLPTGMVSTFAIIILSERSNSFTLDIAPRRNKLCEGSLL